jgi:3-deoxy-D-manno-octulosonic-acid transferase
VYFVYSLLLTIGVIALMPRFLFGALRHRKYITGLSERLGKVPIIEANGRPVVWLHCVSVGETEAARPLVHALRNRFPSHALIISTTTLTGQAFARKAFAEQVAAIFYFPIDWAWTVRRVLSALNPSAVLIMETELWPRLFRECRRREIPVALVNGRISEKSFRGYRIPGRFIRRVVNDLTMALMQSEPDAERLRRLGFPNERIHVSGNLKFDSAKMSGTEELTSDLCDRFGLDRSARLIVAASTHEPEERVICEALQSHFSSPDVRVRLVIAPRHPERFDDVASLLRGSGRTWTRRSDRNSERDKVCEVILLDSIGELRAVYPLADIVFVGGSITPHGGHNMLEPAAAGVCVVTGPHTQNFAAIMKALLENHALVQLPELPLEETTQHLASVLSELLYDDERRRELADNARAVCEQNRGATERAIEMLAGILAPKGRSSESLHFSTRSATATK